MLSIEGVYISAEEKRCLNCMGEWCAATAGCAGVVGSVFGQQTDRGSIGVNGHGSKINSDAPSLGYTLQQMHGMKEL